MGVVVNDWDFLAVAEAESELRELPGIVDYQDLGVFGGQVNEHQFEGLFHKAKRTLNCLIRLAQERRVEKSDSQAVQDVEAD